MPEALLSFRTLHESPLVSVRSYACSAGCSPAGAEEESPVHSIVLMRRGVFRRHFGSRSVTADANQAAFFTAGSTYRVSHPGTCGDDGTILRVAPRVLGDILRELDPAADERRETPFPFATGPCETPTWLRHHELATRLEAGPADGLWADVAALQLAADALQSAHVRSGGAAPPRSARRRGTEADHAETADAAKSWLALHAASAVTLADVAAAVHASPFHLARLFHRHAGMPIHRYLVRLRLRAALEQLAETEDLADLALRTGFASHGHFADAFRREFGRTPSQARADLRRRRGRSQSRKNPEA